MNEALLEISKRSKSFEDADFLPAVFGEFRNEALNGALPVVLFGAGSAGKELYPILRMHGVDPVCFCDNNPSRAGKLYCGLPVLTVPELLRKHSESLIVVTIGAHSIEVRRQLVELGFAEKQILIVSNPEALCYYTHLAQWYWSQEDLRSHKEDLLKVYNLLSDEKSRNIFVSRIALFTGGADYQSFVDFLSKYSDISNKYQSDFLECMHSTSYDTESYLQFNNDVLHLNNDEFFIDGGAFTGDSTLEFITACERNNFHHNKIICFEPDPKIFDQLKKNTAQYDNIVLMPFGLWSSSSTLKFAGTDVLRAGSTRILTEEDTSDMSSGITEIRTSSIDEEFSEEAVTIIKMDIEGAELEALRGAEKTIKKNRPKLIISAYHKRDDLFEIPLIINKMVPDYKLYFRHFSNNFGETTLFAIP
jgi:FkbM family methyltransferase